MSDTLLSHFSFGSEEVYRVKWSWSSPDLLAVGTSNTLQIVRLDTTYVPKVLSVFRLGVRVTHISWGPTVTSEDGKDGPLRLEVLVACADQNLRLLSYQAEHENIPAKSFIKVFGQGHSGHSGRITSISWCSVPGYANIIASAASDKCVLIWNIEATNTPQEGGEPNRPAPTLIGPFTSMPVTISFHPTASGRLMVYDATGTIKLIDWTKPNCPIVMSLHEPRTFVNKLHGTTSGTERMGMANWKVDESDVFGAINGNRWAVWNMRTTCAGNPTATGDAWGPNVVADEFRWCSTNPQLFALSSSSPNASTSGLGAIQIYYTSFPQSPWTLKLPTHVVPARARVHDIEWQPMSTDADVLCAAVGRSLVWMRLGVKKPC